MEATKPAASGGSKPRAPWTEKELAFVLNFADRCLQKKQAYRATVADALSKYGKKTRTAAGIEDKMRRILGEYSDNGYVGFIKNGTRCLNLRSLPATLFAEMQQQRKRWGLSELDGEDQSENSTTEGSATDELIPRKRAATAAPPGAMVNPVRRTKNRDGEDGRKTYREHSVSDSNASDSSDLEFASQPSNKRRKLNQPTRLQPSTAASTSATHKQAMPQKTVAGGVQKAMSAQSQKRKISATESEVVDLSSMSPPPSKRQALEKRADGGAFKEPVAGQGMHSAPQAVSVLPPARQAVRVRGPVQAEKTVPKQSRAAVKETAPVRNQGAPSVHAQQPPSAKDRSGSARTKDDLTALDMVQDLAQLVGVLMQGQAKSEYGLTQEVQDRLKCIRRTVEREPGQLLEKMLLDVHSADAAKADFRALLRDLVGRRELNKDNVFPRVPEHPDMDKAWKTMRKHIQEAFDFSFPPEPLPAPEDAGYLARCIEELAEGSGSLGSMPQYIDKLKPYLDSPHSVQAVLGALFCRRLFATPEPMCTGVYSDKELMMYRALLLNSKYAAFRWQRNTDERQTVPKRYSTLTRWE